MEIIACTSDRWVSQFETWGGLRRNTSLHCNNNVKRKSTNLNEKDIICVEETPLFIFIYSIIGI